MDLKGRLSNPPRQLLSRTRIEDLVEACQRGATISLIAADLGVHRTTVAAHLDRRGVPRHSEQTAWYDEVLDEAAGLHAAGLSLARVADWYGIDARTVAKRFRRVWVPVRPRRKWSPRAQAG